MRALSKPRGDGFTADVWLENDGDAADQEMAAARRGFGGEDGLRLARLGELQVAAVSGRGAVEKVAEACAQAALVVISMPVEAVPSGCEVYDERRLTATGALAIWPEGRGLRIETVAERSGDRPWTRRD